MWKAFFPKKKYQSSCLSFFHFLGNRILYPRTIIVTKKLYWESIQILYYIYYHIISVFVPQILLSFFRFYFCFLSPLNRFENIGYIFPMCFVVMQPTFLTWLVFMYAISNFPLNKYYIYTYYWYNMFVVNRVVNGQPQFKFRRSVYKRISLCFCNGLVYITSWS